MAQPSPPSLSGGVGGGGEVRTMTAAQTQGRIQNKFHTSWPVWAPKKMSPKNKIHC